METPLSIWGVVSDLAVVNSLSAGAAFLVNFICPRKPDKDDDDRRGGSEETPKPEPTGGDWEFNRELDEIGKEINQGEPVGAGIV